MTTSSSFFQENNLTPAQSLSAQTVFASLAAYEASISGLTNITNGAINAYLSGLPTTLPTSPGIVWNNNGSISLS